MALNPITASQDPQSQAPRSARAHDGIRQQVQQTLESALRLMNIGNLPQAELLCRTVLQVIPDHEDAWQLLGAIQLHRGDNAGAIRLLSRAIELKATVADYHYNLGLARQRSGDLSGAQADYRQAIRLNAEYIPAHLNLGVVLQDAGELQAATRAYRQVLKLDRNHVDALRNLAACEQRLGHPAQSLKFIERLLKIQPLHADAHLRRGNLLIGKGDFEAGWDEYEWRWHAPDFQRYNPLRVVPFANVDEHTASQTTVFVAAEQGIGDEIMFSSCIPDAAERFKRVILQCEPRLKPLYERSFPGVTVVSRRQEGQVFRQVDEQIAIGSLPRLFRRSKAAFPASSFLRADPVRREHWKAQLAALPGLRVGISWRGGIDPRAKELRSYPLAQLLPLLSIEGASFIDLQYGDTHAAREELASQHGVKLHHFEEIDPLKDMDELAALTAELDLVISVDNSTVHLAGALGVPCWTILPFACDWRWGADGSESPWYPSMQLLRCPGPSLEEWASFPEVVAQRLSKLVESGKKPNPVLPVTGSDAAQANPSTDSAVTRRRKFVLLNDTSWWYHWGCACTSLAIHDQLRQRGADVFSVPLQYTAKLINAPAVAEDLARPQTLQAVFGKDPALLEQFQSADAVIINGEGTLHNRGAQARALLYCAYVARTVFDKPVHLINHSCYPTDTVELKPGPTADLYAQVYGVLSHVAAREDLSAELVKRLGAKVTPSFDCLPLFVRDHWAAGVNSERQARRIVISGSVSWTAQILDAVAAYARHMQKAGFQVSYLTGAKAYLAGSPAMVVAISMVLALSSSLGTRWLIRPMRRASSASTTRPLNNSSLAMGQPT